MTTNEVQLRCDCGALRGSIQDCSPRRINRGICYCRDCQAFARHLGHSATLDADGGTEILQFSSGMLRFTHGAEHLACLQLTENALMRWFAACCRTPVANTLRKPKVPFVGLISSFIDPELSASDLTQVAGPCEMRVHTGSALTDGKRLAAGRPGAFRMVVGLGGVLAGGWLRGDHKRSPFFGPDGAPVAEVYVLSAEDLAAAKGRRLD